MRNWTSLTMVALMLGPYPTPAAGQGPQFDAATIKLDQRGPGDRRMKGGPGTNSPGRVTWQKVWLQDLVATAFHMDPANVSGPAWSSGNGAQLYLFEATLPPDTSRHDFELMLQRFLIEQFRIKYRTDPKMFPAYELTAAPGGAKLKASADPDAPDMQAPSWNIGPDGFPVLPPGHGQGIVLINGFHGKFQNYTMAEFAEHLTGFVGPPGARKHYVLDKTGLTGVYDFTLKFDQADVDVVTGPQTAAAGVAKESDLTGLPNIFKALEQQLGLRLIKAKDIPRDTLVIEQAERIPRGN